MQASRKTVRGMTLIDVVVGTALIVIVFLALFGLLRASLLLSTLVKDQSTASAVANNQMEYLRSLPYASVGTVGGIPAGTVPQNATTTEDGVAYTVRTFVDYYDDPADGVGAADTNGITTDYKRLKVTVTYSIHTTARSITLVSNYAPPGIETTLNGGTLQINVVNAVGAPLAGATVTITDASTSPTVNLSTFTNSAGIVSLPGAATSTQYAVTVTEPGYSTAQTYARAGANQNPSPGYFTVVKGVTTSGTFAIDALGLLTLDTFSPIAWSAFTDKFTDATKLASLTNTTATGGFLTLTNNGSGYPGSGSAISTTTAPAYLSAWGVASSTISAPAGTTASVQVLNGAGALIPDSVLPGNSAGFTSFPINLSGVSTSTYPALALSATLTSTASSSTPSLKSWTITYQAGPIPLPNVPFTLTGAKTIGTTGAGAPIYKTIINSNTGSTGSDPLSLEWDSYSLALSGYDPIDACNAPPYALAPAAALVESLILGPATSNSLLVSVSDGSGNSVPGATVTLSRSGFTQTVTGSSCGAAYFGGLTAGSAYSVMISKAGYTTNTTSGVTVGGHTFYEASF
jgi:Carboxypeptidase regulatory-like domain